MDLTAASLVNQLVALNEAQRDEFMRTLVFYMDVHLPESTSWPIVPRWRLTAAENKYRREIWLHHGHVGLNGDDGEMQCARCTADYRRDPINQLEHKAAQARILAGLSL